MSSATVAMSDTSEVSEAVIGPMRELAAVTHSTDRPMSGSCPFSRSGRSRRTWSISKTSDFASALSSRGKASGASRWKSCRACRCWAVSAEVCAKSASVNVPRTRATSTRSRSWEEYSMPLDSAW